MSSCLLFLPRGSLKLLCHGDVAGILFFEFYRLPQITSAYHILLSNRARYMLLNED